MTANVHRALTELNRRKVRGWILCGVALVSGAAGSLVTAQVTQATKANAAVERLLELNIYHTVPGKVPALVSRLREAAKLQAKHGLNVIGYWVPYGDPAWSDTFIYIVVHSSRDEAKRNWSAFHADPEFQKYVRSEQTEPLIESVDTAYLRPTDYSSFQ